MSQKEIITRTEGIFSHAYAGERATEIGSNALARTSDDPVSLGRPAPLTILPPTR